ncbi:hypothetical protein [Glutamicibacter nicotianae]|uniref:hypothetical protein n=1 Tax=Glutamicibacter nicotianae TaxID=37929 RepID=UPI00195E26B3|nr:hypothetical protein [Glutamicibacter nicotianae]MBM7766768.1 hypothetical protein [Glutamicibacter nicotianae]
MPRTWASLGRHTNDHMVPFYVRAPGGWTKNDYTAEQITEEGYWGDSHEGAEPLAAFEVPSASGAAS